MVWQGCDVRFAIVQRNSTGPSVPSRNGMAQSMLLVHPGPIPYVTSGRPPTQSYDVTQLHATHTRAPRPARACMCHVCF